MLSVYDLYDLSAVYKNIRFNPQYAKNATVLQMVLSVLYKTSCSYKLNQIRSALASIKDLDNEAYRFAFVENYYTYFPSLLKSEQICNILIYCTEELLTSFKSGNYEKTQDLAECLHDLPIDIAENNFNIPNKFWKLEVAEYRKKWNKNFLLSKEISAQIKKANEIKNTVT